MEWEPPTPSFLYDTSMTVMTMTVGAFIFTFVLPFRKTEKTHWQGEYFFLVSGKNIPNWAAKTRLGRTPPGNSHKSQTYHQKT